MLGPEEVLNAQILYYVIVYYLNTTIMVLTIAAIIKGTSINSATGSEINISQHNNNQNYHVKVSVYYSRDMYHSYSAITTVSTFC